MKLLLLAFLLWKPTSSKGAKLPQPDQLFDAKGARFSVLSDQKADEAPVWAEGGRSIIFRSTRVSWLGKRYKKPADDQQLWHVRLDTGEQTNLAEGVVGWKSVPSWNASLERVLVYADLKKEGPGIYAINPRNPGSFHRIAEPPPAQSGRAVTAVSSSKDGRVIAVVSNDPVGAVWLRRLGDPHDIAWKKLDFGGAKNLGRPVFAPDDKTLYVAAVEDIINQRGPIWRAALDGKPVRLPQDGCCVNVSPLGDELLFVKNRDVQVAGLPAGNWKGTLIKPRQGIIADPKWSPDGRSIVFSWAFGEQGGVYLARFEDKTLRDIREPKKAVPKTPVPAASRQLVAIVTPAWPDDLGLIARYERGSETEAWKLVSKPEPVVLGQAGLAWGIGLHGAGAPAAADGAPEGPLKVEGDKRAPAGAFSLGETLGYADKAPDGAKGLYRQSTDALKCVDDPASGRYNRIVAEGADKDWSTAEDMKRKDDLYKLVVVVGHNTQEPPKKGAGSCIFLHVWRGVKNKTVGCTAMPFDRLSSLVQWLDPQAEPTLVQLPEAVYRRVQTEWALPAPPM